MAEKSEHLVCLDYDKGGVWAYLLAESQEQIRSRLPAVTVVDEPPPWMNADAQARTRERMTVDIDDESHVFIKAAVAAAEPGETR